jgi:hypothetical protein
MPPAVPRRLATLAAGASLLLCVATVALWVRSYRRVDAFRVATARGERIVGSVRGELQFILCPGIEFSGTFSYDSYSAPGFRSAVEFLRTDRHYSSGGRLGFGYFVPKAGAPKNWGYSGVWFPHWSLALLFAILPALHLRAAIRSRRRDRVALCLTCGYDLRATPARCPECGAVPAAPPAR